MVTGVGDVDVEAGRLSSIVEASLPDAHSEDPQPAALDGMVVQLASYSGGGVSAEPLAHGPIEYPPSFLALVCITGALAASCIFNFFVVTAPALDAHMKRAASHNDDRKWRRCYYDDLYAKWACFAIVFCFFLFVTVRGLILVKPIGRRLQAAHHGRLGPRMMYFSIVVVHGPLLIFTVGSLLFTITEQCRHNECEDMKLIRTVKMFGFYSFLVAMMSCAALLWNALLHAGAVIEARRQNGNPQQAARILAKIPTVPYDPELFGFEDGRRYHGECSICLEEFEAADEIKVLYCGHAYHKDCLGRWLRKKRTCALCRQDVMQASEAGADGVRSGADVAVPGTSGLEEATPGTATSAHSGVAHVQPIALGRLASADGAAASHRAHDTEAFPTHERSAER